MNCHTAAQAEAGEGERRHAQCLVLLAEGALPLFSRKKIILVAALPCLAGEVGLVGELCRFDCLALGLQSDNAWLAYPAREDALP